MAEAKKGRGRPANPVYRYFDRYPTNPTVADCRECEERVASAMGHCVWHALEKCDLISLADRMRLRDELRAGGFEIPAVEPARKAKRSRQFLSVTGRDLGVLAQMHYLFHSKFPS